MIEDITDTEKRAIARTGYDSLINEDLLNVIA